ncbi:IclR family transcriptional regulator C-terminal domain-containing protein [Kribbella sp. NPDC051770]|uniref:IclR family transcriptional regulator domain-containing protein n=1 Tax=Kribbella sp. NPDC051770 TaxID=3155413 RepID=UPI0034171929
MNPSPEAGQDRDFVQSIERGFAVLLAFDADLPNPTLAEIATRTGYSRPAVRRILLTLQRLGYVAGAGPRWSLTPKVLTIGQHYAATHGIVEVAQPHLLRLAEATQESASLAQLDGTDVVYVARVQVRRILSIAVDVGSRVPAYATSMGRVLTAWAPPAVVEAVIEAGLPRRAERTITDPVRFRDALHDVRRLGYAVAESELEDGLLSAAVPVVDQGGEVMAALAYSSTLGRTTPERLVAEVVPLMLDAAKAIGRDLAAVRTTRTLAPSERDGFF